MVKNYNGASLGLISPIEKMKIAVKTHPQITAAIRTVKNIGTKKTDQVLWMNYEAHLIIATPNLILPQRHNIISANNPAIAQRIYDK